jgi:hypothetical protein
MVKTVPLSVRISHEDAAFLARLAVPGAVTASEKVRALIGEARERHRSATEPEESVAFIMSIIERRYQEVRAVQGAAAIHSEFVARIGGWLPGFMSLFLKKPIAKTTLPADVTESEALRRFEKELVGEVFGLMEGALRLAVTREEPCYDPAVISSNLSVIQELVELVVSTKTRKSPALNQRDAVRSSAVCDPLSAVLVTDADS